jgi:xylose isomerase
LSVSFRVPTVFEEYSLTATLPTRDDGFDTEALAAARSPELAVPTLADGETHEELLADQSAFEDFGAEAAGARHSGVERLAQPAVEHLLGAR